MWVIRGEKVDVHVEDLGYRLRFRIRTRRGWAMYVAVTVVALIAIPATWVAVSLLTGGGSVEGLPVSGERITPIFATVSGIGLLLVIAVVGGLVVQMLLGYEEIEVGPGTVVSRIGLLGWRRQYPTVGIRDLRLDMTIPEGLARGDYEGCDSPPLPVTPIIFECDGRTARIGRTMYEPEAAQVLAMIRERM